jgi:hypothetical protein
MPTTTFGVLGRVPVTATPRRARGARPAAGAETTTPSGTSPGIPAGRSWGRPTPAGCPPRRPGRAHRSPVARIRAPGAGAPGDALVPGLPADRVAQPGRVAQSSRVEDGARRPAVPRGRARPGRETRNPGDETPAPGRHRAQVGPRRPANAVAVASPASPAQAAPPGSTTSGPLAPTGSSAKPRGAAARSHRRVLSRLPDDRCGTPTSGRPTGAAESRIAAGVRCSPWVTPSMSRR